MSSGHESAPSSTELGQVRLLLEQVVGQNKLVLEHVVSLNERFEARLAEALAPILARLDIIEAVLAEHSRILAEHSRILAEHSRILDAHSQALRELQAEAHAARADRVADREILAKLDARVTALEQEVAATIAR
jgi:hypothetical protein